MKKTQIFNIAVILLLVVHFVLMFVPYFSFEGAEMDYSIMNYCWTHCTDMKKILRKMIEDYWINDYVSMLLITQVAGVLALAFNMGRRNALVAHLLTYVWAVLAIITFATDSILWIDGANNTVYILSWIVIGLTTAVSVIRIFFWKSEVWDKLKKKRLF